MCEKKVKRQAKGFTLIELIIVIVLLLIIGATIAPRISDITLQTETNMAARKIAADIRYVRQLALATHHPHGVNFDGNPVNIYSLYWSSKEHIITNPYTGAHYTVQLNSGEFAGVTLDDNY